jgi:hypothetical protein
MSIVFWSNLKPEQFSETATLCVRLLKDRLDEKISEAEFEKELNYVAIQPSCLRDFEYKPAPPQTIEFQKASEELEKEKLALRANEILDMAAFHKAHPCLVDYMGKKDESIRRNKRNAEELEGMHAYFKKLGDTVAVMKVYEAYQTYPRSLWSGDNKVWERRTL